MTSFGSSSSIIDALRLKYKTFFVPNNIFAYQMEKEVSIDVDIQFDFDISEYLINKREKEILDLEKMSAASKEVSEAILENEIEFTKN